MTGWHILDGNLLISGCRHLIFLDRNYYTFGTGTPKSFSCSENINAENTHLISATALAIPQNIIISNFIIFRRVCSEIDCELKFLSV